MKKFTVLLFALLVACAPAREVVTVINGNDGAPGADGKDGISCSVSETENGLSLSCADGQEFFVRNGIDGINGQDGQDGLDGADGQDGSDGTPGAPGTPGTPGAVATLTDFSSSSCTHLTGLYYGKSKSNAYEIYLADFVGDNDCDDNDKVLNMSEDNSAYWLDGNILAIFLTPNDLRIINFN